MKYKLKKWYPTLPATWKAGDVITRDAQYYKHDAGLIHRFISWSEVENNPEFWEKVIDFEILSFKYSNTIFRYTESPAFSIDKDYRHYVAADGGLLCEASMGLLLGKFPEIYSVKRLSDGEIFSVGDKIDCKGWFGNIIKFEIVNTELKIFQQQHIDSSKYKPLSIQELIKFKQPLFKTEDGVNIFEHSVYHSVYLPTVEYMGGHCAEIPNNGKYTSDACKTFSTKEKAEEYVLMNKPCLSIKEIAPIFGMYHLDNSRTSLDRLTEKLKDLVKSKQ